MVRSGAGFISTRSGPVYSNATVTVIVFSASAGIWDFIRYKLVMSGKWIFPSQILIAKTGSGRGELCCGVHCCEDLMALVYIGPPDYLSETVDMLTTEI